MWIILHASLKLLPWLCWLAGSTWNSSIRPEKPIVSTIAWFPVCYFAHNYGTTEELVRIAVECNKHSFEVIIRLSLWTIVSRYSAGRELSHTQLIIQNHVICLKLSWYRALSIFHRPISYPGYFELFRAFRTFDHIPASGTTKKIQWATFLPCSCLGDFRKK